MFDQPCSTARNFRAFHPDVSTARVDVLVARRFLEQRDAAVEQFSKPEVIEGRLRIG